MGIVYKLTFQNGKAYVGVTSKSLKRRVTQHLSSARKGGSYALHKAIRAYGEGSFSSEILCDCDDREALFEMEREAIVRFKTKAPYGYNLTDGGEGIHGHVRTVEQRLAMSLASKGRNLGNKFGMGYRHTTEARRKISEAGMGRIFSLERIEKIRASKIGNTYALGRVVSEEAKRRSSEAQRGRPKLETAKSAMSAAKKGKPWTPARRAAQEARKQTNGSHTSS